MPAVRCRFHYRNYVLNDDGAVFGTPLVGTSVLIERELDDVFLPFAGFVLLGDVLHFAGYEEVRIKNIEGFTPNNDAIGAWSDLPRGTIVKGLKRGDQIYVGLTLQNERSGLAIV